MITTLETLSARDWPTATEPHPIQEPQDVNDFVPHPTNRRPQLSHGIARRRLDEFLAPLNKAASSSLHLSRRPGLAFGWHGRRMEIPSYRFTGPQGGGDAVKIGLFAVMHGDDPESGMGLIRFLLDLVEHPELASGFVLHAYPICNPTGFEDGTRHSRSGRDLNREFWIGSSEPEVRLLEGELLRHQFNGLVALHCDDTSHGLYGFLSGRERSAVLSEALLEPALRAGEQFLPRNRDSQIDGFQARSGILASCYDGVLRAPEQQSESPFEITFETPQLAAVDAQVQAFSAALRSMLEEYRRLQSYAPNL